MKKIFLLSFAILAFCAGISMGQIKRVIGRGDHVEIEVADAAGKLTTFSGTTTADAVAKSRAAVLSAKHYAPLSDDQHPTPSILLKKPAKDEFESISSLKPVPLMATPLPQENGAPKN